MNTMKMKTWYSDEWCNDDRAASQEELQKIAKQIRENCKCIEICEANSSGTVCTIYINEALGIKYWVKDNFGHISEIIEARSH